MRKKILSLLLALTSVASFGFAACGDEGGSGKGGKDYTDVVGMGNGSGKNTTDLDYKPADTGYSLVENGVSEYVIVIPDGVTSWEVTTAYEEFNVFFERSTGIALPVVKDTNLSYDRSKKYISLGDTKIFDGADLDLTYDVYKEDGFHILTDGAQIIINGAEEDGAIFGVYEFLWYNLGIRIYGENEFKIPDHTQDTVKVKAFDYKSVPTFDNRSIGISYQRYSAITEQRLGLNKNNGKNWILWCHTTFKLLDPKVYYADHPDWYNDQVSQLCMTNEEMKAALTEQIWQWFEKSSVQHALLQVGQEDGSTFCTGKMDNEKGTCHCKEDMKLYGGESGILMRLINDIADVINVRVKEKYPNGERTLQLAVFAYSKTQEPPVVRNKDGSYSPAHESVIAHENVQVMLAPLSADWAHSMVDPVYNANWNYIINGWKVVCNNFSVYTYNNVFDNQLYFMDSWSYVKEQYQMWQSLGAEIIFDQSMSHINLPFFELCSYVRSRLLWDSNADVEYYINDFMDNYYKAGAPYARKYFDLLRTRYKLLELEYAENGKLYHQYSYVRNDPSLYEAANWPKDWLLSAVQMFEEGLDHIEKTMAAGDDKTKALNRLKAEMMGPIYLLMDLYATDMTGVDIRYYCAIFRDAAEVNGINYYDEHGKSANRTITALVNDWLTYAD